MTYTLDWYFYSGANRAREPFEVRSESDLDRALAAILAEPQPHPTQIAARELPRFGPAQIPDRMFKMDVSPTGEHVALHYFGPSDPRRAVRMVTMWAKQSAPEQTRSRSAQVETLVLQHTGNLPPSTVDATLPPEHGLDLTLERRPWVTLSATAVPDDVPTLYVDSANETEFPRDAIIPRDLAVAALLEFAVTGVRPESVRWQPFETY